MTRTTSRNVLSIGEMNWHTETTFPVDQTGHTVFLSYAGHGKTLSAMKWFRMALALQPQRQFLILDSTNSWQHVQTLLKRGQLQHFTIGEQGNPLRLNLCKIPNGWSSDRYADTFASVFAKTYGLDGSDERLVSSVLKTMYDLAGADDCPENSASVSLDGMHRFIRTMMHRFELSQAPNETPEWVQLKRLSKHFHRFVVGQRDHLSFGRNSRLGVETVCTPGDKTRVTLIDCHRANPQTRQLVFGLTASVQLQGSRVNPTHAYGKTLIVDTKESLFNGGSAGQLPSNAMETVQLVYTVSRVTALPAEMMKRVQTVFVGRLYNDDYRHLLSVFHAGSANHFIDRVMWLRDGEFLCLRKRHTALKVSFLPPQ